MASNITSASRISKSVESIHRLSVPKSIGREPNIFEADRRGPRRTRRRSLAFLFSVGGRVVKMRRRGEMAQHWQGGRQNVRYWDRTRMEDGRVGTAVTDCFLLTLLILC
ncbi:hypothetical protein RBB50_012165 [Rhinocladiella similis]